MRKIIFTLSLLSSVGVFAQQSNKEAAALLEQKGYFGYFGYQLDEKHNINVNYAFSPKVPTNEIEISLHTPEPRPLSLKIVDLSGTTKLDWKPEQNLYLLKDKIDVSQLPAGRYKYIIMWEDKKVYEIPFEKK